MPPEKLAVMQTVFPFIALLLAICIGGWVLTTWLRIKNGYPLDGPWGQSIYPHQNLEDVERVALLGEENARLRTELDAIEDRLRIVERIVTDRSHDLNIEIEALRSPRPVN